MDYVVNGNVQSCAQSGVDNLAVLNDEDGKPVAGPGVKVDPLARPPSNTVTVPLGRRADEESPVTVRRDGRRFLRARSIEHEKCYHEIVVHSLDDIDVEALCESESSWGPDMVSLKQGKYCDMCEHELYDICKSRTQLGCWDLGKKKLRVAKHQKRSDGSSYPGEKAFAYVMHWE